MGAPKAELSYHGEAEFVRLYRLLSGFCDEVFLSVSDNWRPGEQAFRLLEDRGLSKGPLSGVAAAFTLHPTSAFIVVACDMPLFDAQALKELISHRDATMHATCFSLDGTTAEPLCAIYEAGAGRLVFEALSRDMRCARRVMQTMSVKYVKPSNPSWVRNVNSKEEFESFSSAGPALQVDVTYVAMLREAAGKSQEWVATRATTPRALFEELRSRYAFALKAERMRVAINDEIVPWSTPLNDKDRLIFVPPVAGG